MATNAQVHPHAHALPTGPALAVAARACVEAAGEQWTSLRAAVFDTLAGFDRPASAYDVAEAASARVRRRIAANSVYRILDLFVGVKVAMRVESRNAYLVNEHPGCAHDCIFLVCDRCEATAHLDDDRVASALRDAATVSGFTPSRPVIEVRGLCKACS